MEERLQKLRQILLSQEVDAVLISSVPNIYYLTGYGGFSSEERDAFLFVTQKKAYLFTNALYIHAVEERVTHFEVIEQNRDNPLNKLISKLAKKEKVNVCGFEDTNLTVAEFTPLAELDLEFETIELDTLRIIKDKNEIEAIQKACEVGDKAFTYIKEHIKPGITETQLAHHLDLFIKKEGYDISFRSIVAFGRNAAVPHHFSADDALGQNTCALLDFGVKYKSYCSDMTRTVFLGKVSASHKKVYETVLAAQQKAIDILSQRLASEGPENILMKDIDLAARNYILEQGYPSIPHTLGHGIGLEVHEGFRLYKTVDDHFENGMVFSIEPGIYIPNDIGVRIEDLFAIQDNKLIRLTHSPRELTTV
jgi:Xaa-Pro aminopeptidase